MSRHSNPQHITGIESQLPLRNFFAALVIVNHNTPSLENFNGNAETFCTEKIFNAKFFAVTRRTLYDSIQNCALGLRATQRFSSFRNFHGLAIVR